MKILFRSILFLLILSDTIAMAQTMDHAMSSMQGGTAPPDARDPHAYSGGYTLHDGPYKVSSAHQHISDHYLFRGVNVDRLEWVDGDPDAFSAYEGKLWLGGSYRRVIVDLEGEVSDGEWEEAKTALLYSQAISAYWDMRGGLRYDSGHGPDRRWLAFGVAGLAPYWFEIDITAYLGEAGRSALVAEVEYELLITQRWILQPRVEMTLYGGNDRAAGNGSGLSDISAGLRLRYEISRQFAPYVGLEWAGRFGESADLTRATGGSVRDIHWLAGVRFWF